MQLLVRDDALKEACGVEYSTQSGAKMLDVPPQPKTTLSHTSSISSSPKSLSILVVEDNLVNQRVVTKQLLKAGHIVSVANNGQEALDFIRSSAYWKLDGRDYFSGEKLSVVLLDLEMPVMDGITCIKKIRELQEQGEIRGHVPVIAVTANAREDQVQGYIEAGMVSLSLARLRLLTLSRGVC